MEEAKWLKREVLHILDLIPLSTSSVAPTFSIAAAYGSMVAIMGSNAIMAVVVSFPLFLFSSFILRKLNRKSPHAGASYHWGMKFMGKKYGSFQFWVVTLAYFLSLPPIIIPAGEYTLDLLYRLGIITRMIEMSVFWDSIVGIFWAIFASIPLLLGAKPTARFTEVFLVMELIILSSFIVLGLISLPEHVINQFSWNWLFSISWISSLPTFLGLAATMVIVATILDGWEIDSYSSEESKKPHKWPGTSGIIGLVSVFIIYLITMPIMTIETPISALSVSVDPLARWASYVIPGFVWLMDIAVIASTASSLWLTAYILSRAWYAAGREGLMPSFFSKVNKYGSPSSAIIIMTIAEIAVQLLELTSPTILSFFVIMLSAAGTFLLMEFGIDALTSTFIFFKQRGNWFYKLISPITVTAMFLIISLGIVNSATVFGIPSLNYLIIVIAMLIPGIYFMSRSNKVKIIIPSYILNLEKQEMHKEQENSK
ncbi:APC family permease [Acidianus sp. RZ1]|uniref:APC family permease n=1 Tax=Acidianus sp. RZ1 TaxID=1540082 RepID=UPI0014925868|nr:APC family permease [Acidianus sp. RZ1]NON63431.1 APC family permease [Acidianus sp. RZ1]